MSKTPKESKKQSNVKRGGANPPAQADFDVVLGLIDSARKQAYATVNTVLAPLLRELSWTHNLLILGKSKRDEEREFYLRLSIQEHWSSRQLERQINGALFERVVLSPVKLSAPLRELHPEAASIFKDGYLVEFLDLPKDHSEPDLQKALIENLKRFLIELGRDFCFVGSQYPLQVGGRDFALDLLFSSIERSIASLPLN